MVMSMNDKKVVLTGIKPTGQAHLGNYLGAIKPALTLAQEYNARYFIADYHALNGIKDPALLRTYTHSIAACWLACGLDPDKVVFYRQSDVPEIFELSTMLMAFTAKGLMNRAHAYKAMVDKNTATGEDADAGINMGLFTYPVLMAADILLLDAELVPVGHDQKQHLEMAADIAQAINFNYQQPLLTLPKPFFATEGAYVTGLDGRKMSKSYHNVIPLFAESKALKKLVNSIKTNSQGVEEAKDPEGCAVFALYKLFASAEQQAQLSAQYRAGGMGWGVAKVALYEVLEAELSPIRTRYEQFMSDPSGIDAVLRAGAAKVRPLAQAKIAALRTAMGLS